MSMISSYSSLFPIARHLPAFNSEVTTSSLSIDELSMGETVRVDHWAARSFKRVYTRVLQKLELMFKGNDPSDLWRSIYGHIELTPWTFNEWSDGSEVKRTRIIKDTLTDVLGGILNTEVGAGCHYPRKRAALKKVETHLALIEHNRRRDTLSRTSPVFSDEGSQEWLTSRRRIEPHPQTTPMASKGKSDDEGDDDDDEVEEVEEGDSDSTCNKKNYKRRAKDLKKVNCDRFDLLTAKRKRDKNEVIIIDLRRTVKEYKHRLEAEKQLSSLRNEEFKTMRDYAINWMKQYHDLDMRRTINYKECVVCYTVHPPDYVMECTNPKKPHPTCFICYQAALAIVAKEGVVAPEGVRFCGVCRSEFDVPIPKTTFTPGRVNRRGVFLAASDDDPLTSREVESIEANEAMHAEAMRAVPITTTTTTTNIIEIDTTSSGEEHVTTNYETDEGEFSSEF